MPEHITTCGDLKPLYNVCFSTLTCCNVQGFGGAALNKFGFKTESTGELKVRPVLGGSHTCDQCHIVYPDAKMLRVSLECSFERHPIGDVISGLWH